MSRTRNRNSKGRARSMAQNLIEVIVVLVLIANTAMLGKIMKKMFPSGRGFSE
jgi:hypothetical protein